MEVIQVDLISGPEDNVVKLYHSCCCHSKMGGVKSLPAPDNGFDPLEYLQDRYETTIQNEMYKDKDLEYLINKLKRTSDFDLNLCYAIFHRIRHINKLIEIGVKNLSIDNIRQKYFDMLFIYSLEYPPSKSFLSSIPEVYCLIDSYFQSPQEQQGNKILVSIIKYILVSFSSNDRLLQLMSSIKNLPVKMKKVITKMTHIRNSISRIEAENVDRFLENIPSDAGLDYIQGYLNGFDSGISLGAQKEQSNLLHELEDALVKHNKDYKILCSQRDRAIMNIQDSIGMFNNVTSTSNEAKESIQRKR